ncbi:MAG: pyridoxamine 5'-phosphate oxidase family protein [Spirochaetes bacterium]|nr:pyridoxamine 5'-phosphate oxidase family protein [Spirochaetota bacterium]
MTVQEMLRRLDELLETSRVGILTTVDSEGYPRSRWMTPAFVPGREGMLYAVTSPAFAKTMQISKYPKVGWIFQTRALDEIMTVQGKINIIENPALRSEVQEALGRNLSIFWRVNPREQDLVVLETVIEAITYFNPMKNERYEVVV